MATVFRRLASRPTLSFAVACAVLLLVVVVVILSIRTDKPVTLAGVTDEVNAGLDLIEDELPSDATVVSASTSRTEACPDGSAGSLVYIDRTITLAPEFDGSAWAAELAREYNDKEGWSSTVKTLDARDHLRVTLVNRTLLVYTLTTGSEDAPARLTLRSGSRCSLA